MSSQIGKAQVPTVGDIAPQSIAAAANAVSGWIAASQAFSFITRANLGVLGSGAVTLSFEQAQDSGGTGSKALSTWTGGSSSTNAANIDVENDPAQLDLANGFTHFRAKLANVGGSGALVSAIVEGASARYTS